MRKLPRPFIPPQTLGRRRNTALTRCASRMPCELESDEEPRHVFIFGVQSCLSPIYPPCYHPYASHVSTKCPLFRKGDRQPYFNHPVKTNHRLQAEAHYKLIRTLQAAGLVTPQHPSARRVTKGITRLLQVTRCALRYEPYTNPLRSS